MLHTLNIRAFRAAILAGAALASVQVAVPASAQDSEREARIERREAAAAGGGQRQQSWGNAQASQQSAPAPRGHEGGGRAWGQRGRQGEGGFGQPAQREDTDRAFRSRSEARPDPMPAPVQAGSYGADNSPRYTAPRDRSYGAYARSRPDIGRQPQPGTTAPPSAPVASDQGRSWRGGAAGRGDWNRGRNADNRVEERRRDERRDGYRQDGNWNRGTDGAWHNNDRNWDRNNDRNWDRGESWRSTDRRWDRDHDRRWDRHVWRNDNRYDWYRYRAANRSLYSLGRYYAPYRNYSYSRFSIGFRIGSLFYSSRYWINDPWRYRLPDVYGPYRWIRYYDDALLVDIYTGEVVDVIYDFFW